VANHDHAVGTSLDNGAGHDLVTFVHELRLHHGAHDERHFGSPSGTGGEQGRG
jgi:hypothetical protein